MQLFTWSTEHNSINKMGAAMLTFREEKIELINIFSLTHNIILWMRSQHFITVYSK